MINSLGFYEVDTKVEINCPYLNDNLKNCTGTVVEYFSVPRDGEMIHCYIIYIPKIKDNVVIEQKYLTAKSDINVEENVILTGLYELGYRYIAMNKDYSISAFNYAPAKSINGKWVVCCMKELDVKIITVPMFDKYLLHLCSSSDTNPTSIAWLLDKPNLNDIQYNVKGE